MHHCKIVRSDHRKVKATCMASRRTVRKSSVSGVVGLPDPLVLPKPETDEPTPRAAACWTQYAYSE